MLTRLKTLFSSAAFWALLLLIAGPVMMGVGVGMLFGVGYGLTLGGFVAIAYGAAVLRRLTNG